MTDAFSKPVAKRVKYLYSTRKTSTGKTTRLTGRQESYFHAHKECDRCKQGIEHVHVYKDTKTGKILKEKYRFKKGSKHLSGVQVK